MARYGQWYIGPSTGGGIRGVEVNSIEICPEELADTDWYEYDGTAFIEVEDIQINCVANESIHHSDDYQSLNDESILSSVETSDNFRFQNILEANFNTNDVNKNASPTQSDIARSIGKDLPFEVTIENDPRDIYFILQNWSDIWESHSTGWPVYSSNYPGGIFQTVEGYEFELEIYPQECR